KYYTSFGTSLAVASGPGENSLARLRTRPDRQPTCYSRNPCAHGRPAWQLGVAVSVPDRSFLRGSHLLASVAQPAGLRLPPLRWSLLGSGVARSPLSTVVFDGDSPLDPICESGIALRSSRTSAAIW